MNAHGAEREVAAALSLPGLGLAELNAEAELLDRVDRKYFVSPELFARLMDEHGHQYSALDIDGALLFDYRTTYFDSPRFDLFRQHVQRRRRRYKVRVREYCDTGIEMLEVKSRGFRGRTVKTRIPYVADVGDPLGAGGRPFVLDALSAGAHGPEWDASLRTSAITDYRRTTLVDRAGGIDRWLVRHDDPEWHGWWGENPPFHTPVIVLTHRPRDPIECDGGTTFHFLNADPVSALDAARSFAGSLDVRLGGGGTTVREFMKAGLVDMLHIVQVPILLGRGVRLWDGLEGWE